MRKRLDSNDFSNNEYKEMWYGNIDGELSPPPIPKNFPGDVENVYGISYPLDNPNTFLDPDEAYEIAKIATYFVWNFIRQRWMRLGGPGAYLKHLSICTGHEISWPNPYPNHRKFNYPKSHQVRIWAELCRRHYEQGRYVSDHDQTIHRTYINPNY